MRDTCGSENGLGAVKIVRYDMGKPSHGWSCLPPLVEISQIPVPNGGIYATKLRTFLAPFQDIEPGEVVTTVETGIDLSHKLQIGSRVHGPAQRSIAGRCSDVKRAKSPFDLVQIRHHMLALMRTICLLPCLVQGVNRADFRIEADGERAVVDEAVSGKVHRRFGLEEGGHPLIDEARIEKRAA